VSRALTTGDEIRGPTSVLDVHLNSRELALHSERAELRRRIVGMADPDLLHLACNGLGQLVVATAGHDRPAQHRADLSAHQRDRPGQQLRRGISREVVAHDCGGLAAELQRTARDPFAAHARDAFADRGGAGEAHLVHVRVAHQVIARRAVAARQVDDARRNAGRLGGLRDDVGLERRLR
jgi:hypothetical protein